MWLDFKNILYILLKIIRKHTVAVEVGSQHDLAVYRFVVDKVFEMIVEQELKNQVGTAEIVVEIVVKSTQNIGALVDIFVVVAVAVVAVVAAVVVAVAAVVVAVAAAAVVVVVVVAVDEFVVADKEIEN